MKMQYVYLAITIFAGMTLHTLGMIAYVYAKAFLKKAFCKHKWINVSGTEKQCQKCRKVTNQ